MPCGFKDHIKPKYSPSFKLKFFIGTYYHPCVDNQQMSIARRIADIIIRILLLYFHFNIHVQRL